jgi:DNA-binding MarR family transcriptional regulator
VAKQNALISDKAKKGRAASSSATPSRSPLRGIGGGRAAVEATPEIDRLIHERLRLGIVSALAVNDSMTFSELKDLLKTTDGNLSVHARKLEEAEYILCTKSFEGRTPKTEYKLAAAGRRALQQYLDHMEALIKTMRVR